VLNLKVSVLVVKGETISKTYKFFAELEHLQRECELLVSDNISNPLSLGSKKFNGKFYGENKTKFELKTNSNFFVKDSLNNLIDVKGEIIKIDNNKCSIQIEFSRSEFLMCGHFIMLGVYVLFLLFFGFKSLKLLLGMSIVLFPFYILGTGISLEQVNGQVRYYEKHLINTLKSKFKD